MESKGKTSKILVGQSEGRESFEQHRKHNEQKNKQDASVCEGTYLADFSITLERRMATVTEILLGVLSPSMKILIRTNCHNVS